MTKNVLIIMVIIVLGIIAWILYKRSISDGKSIPAHLPQVPNGALSTAPAPTTNITVVTPPGSNASNSTSTGTTTTSTGTTGTGAGGPTTGIVGQGAFGV